MPTPKATEVNLSEEERTGLEQLVRRHNVGQQIALRGRIILAAGREAHYKRVEDLLGNLPDKPAADASPKEKMAYKLATDIGKEIYRLRKCTVEPVIGIIKEILGFRQFSLRDLKNAAGEWCLPQVPCVQFETHALDMAVARTLLTGLLLGL